MKSFWDYNKIAAELYKTPDEAVIKAVENSIKRSDGKEAMFLGNPKTTLHVHFDTDRIQYIYFDEKKDAKGHGQGDRVKMPLKDFLNKARDTQKSNSNDDIRIMTGGGRRYLQGGGPPPPEKLLKEWLDAKKEHKDLFNKYKNALDEYKNALDEENNSDDKKKEAEEKAKKKTEDEWEKIATSISGWANKIDGYKNTIARPGDALSPNGGTGEITWKAVIKGHLEGGETKEEDKKEKKGEQGGGGKKGKQKQKKKAKKYTKKKKKKKKKKKNKSVSLRSLPEMVSAFLTPSSRRKKMTRHPVPITQRKDIKRRYQPKQTHRRTLNSTRSGSSSTYVPTLIYFYMDGCDWCKDFEKRVWPSVKKIKGINLKRLNIKGNHDLVKKYGIKTVPALVRIYQGKHKLFTGGEKARTISNIRKFIK